jgi:2-keto-4-pentenoate hydratase
MHGQPARRAYQAARWLVRQHLEKRRSTPLPASIAPGNLDEAYAVQEAFCALKATHCGTVSGHKIALTTPQMRALVGLDAPIAGRMHARQLVRGPGRVRAASYGRLLVEFEIAFRMAADLPADGGPYDLAAVAGAVDTVMPAFELADDRGADYATLPSRGLELAADNAWNEGAVLGAPAADWRALDLAALRGVAYIDGRPVGEGHGADSMGHPLAALQWVANHLAARRQGLRRGDIVISGSLVTSKFPPTGSELRFEVGGLGAVELRVD